MKYNLLIEIVVGGSAFAIFLYQLKKYTKCSACKYSSSIAGLNIIVTGATSTVGKATALQLAKRGAHIILACRNLKLGKEVCEEIKSITGNKHICVKYIDLSSLKTVKKFSDAIHCEYKEIFALVNNAGISYGRQELTPDGFDSTLQINFISAYFLTYLLLDLLKNSRSAKIVNVTSQAHYIPTLRDVRDIVGHQTSKRSYIKAYGISKLALLSFSCNLAEELKETNISVYAVDPGNCETSIYRTFLSLGNFMFEAFRQKPLQDWSSKAPVDNSQSVIHAILTSKHSTGSYIFDCKEAPFSPLAKDKKLYAILQETIINSCKPPTNH